MVEVTVYNHELIKQLGRNKKPDENRQKEILKSIKRGHAYARSISKANQRGNSFAEEFEEELDFLGSVSTSSAMDFYEDVFATYLPLILDGDFEELENHLRGSLNEKGLVRMKDFRQHLIEYFGSRK